jgi:hypothetical protein
MAVFATRKIHDDSAAGYGCVETAVNDMVAHSAFTIVIALLAAFARLRIAQSQPSGSVKERGEMARPLCSSEDAVFPPIQS